MKINMIYKMFLRMKKRMRCAAYLLAAGVLVFCCCCCGNHMTDTSLPIPLAGTKWKLSGFVDVQSGILTEAEPKNCEKCYTLEFESDSVAYGKSVANQLAVFLSQPPMIRVMTEVGDSHNGNAQLFYDAVAKEIMDSYRIEENELRFFYNNRRNYLLYKLVQQ